MNGHVKLLKNRSKLGFTELKHSLLLGKGEGGGKPPFPSPAGPLSFEDKSFPYGKPLIVKSLPSPHEVLPPTSWLWPRCLFQKSKLYIFGGGKNIHCI